MKIERRVCLPRGTEGSTSDSWAATGVFHHNNQTFVELDILYRIRNALVDKTPMKTWITDFLDQARKDPAWLSDIPKEIVDRQGFTCADSMFGG